jgi:hypothetical protein
MPITIQQRRKTVARLVLPVVTAIVLIVAVYFAFPSPHVPRGSLTVIPSGTVEALTVTGAGPACYDVSFNLDGTAVLNGTIEATNAVDWTVSGGNLLYTGSLVSGQITETLLPGGWNIGFCSQDIHRNNTIMFPAPFVATYE